MKKIALIFLISFCLGQNTYIGSVSFDYSGSINGSFNAELTDSTFGGASAIRMENEDGTSFLISAFQPIDSVSISALFIYLQSPDSNLTSSTWILPPNDFENPDVVFGFFPEIDTSFFSQFADLIPDSIEQDSMLLDSTFLEDLITEILLIISDDTYLGLSGSININTISADSINGSFDVGALKAGIPPGVINISNGSINLNGVVLPQVGVENEPAIPDKFTLYPAFPNPFNPTTTIRFSVEKSNLLSLRIYDITGKLVETLVNKTLSAGEYEIIWNASSHPSGVYYVQLVSGNNVQSEKVLLMK